MCVCECVALFFQKVTEEGQSWKKMARILRMYSLADGKLGFVVCCRRHDRYDRH